MSREPAKSAGGGARRRRRSLLYTVMLIGLLAALIILPAACAGDEAADTGAGSETTAPAAGSTQSTDPEGEASSEVVLMTHDSFAIPEEVMNLFQEQTGLQVRVLRAGDAGAMLNQAILTKNNPLADVIFGVDNTFLSRALDEEVFQPFSSSLLNDVPDEFRLDDQNRVTPIDYGDVCLNYDKEQVGEGKLAVPPSLRDLTSEEYRGKLVVENPATSSPGLAFLLSTVAEFGERESGSPYSWQEFWQDLKKNEVLVVSGWEEAYYSEFSGGAGEGDRPLVVSYASSPPAEVIFAETPPAEAPTGVVTEGAFRQIEFAGVVKGAKNVRGAERLIDFMLGLEFQQAVPESMFVFPVNEQAKLPESFTKHTAIPENPLTMDYREIGENRERWIQEWTDIVTG